MYANDFVWEIVSVVPAERLMALCTGTFQFRRCSTQILRVTSNEEKATI